MYRFINFKDINKLYSKLTMLEFKNCKILNSDLLSILKLCSKLESLTMQKICSIGQFVMNHQDMEQLKISLSNVRVLDLSCNDDLTNNKFVKLTECMPNLESLDVRNSLLVSSAFDDALTSDCVRWFLTNRGEKIKSLKISGFGIHDSFIERLMNEANLNLQELSISSVCTVEQRMIQKFVKTQRELTSLELNQDFKVLKLGIDVFIVVNNLKHLTIGNAVEPLNLNEWLFSLTELQSLSIQNAKFGKKHWEELKESLEFSNSRNSLKTLNISCPEIDEAMIVEMTKLLPNLGQLQIANSKLDNQMVKVILAHAKRLKIFNIAGAKGLTNSDLSEINDEKIEEILNENVQPLRKFSDEAFEKSIVEVQGMNIDGAKSLNNSSSIDNLAKEFMDLFQPTARITDEACERNIAAIQKMVTQINEIGQGKPDLENLDLSATPIGNGTLLLTSHLKSLREINLQNCQQINDVGFIILGLKCPKLEIVNLSHCDITDYGLLGMLRFTNRISKLDLTACHKITSRAVSKIPSFCLHLKCCKLTSFNRVDRTVHPNRLPSKIKRSVAMQSAIEH